MDDDVSVYDHVCLPDRESSAVETASGVYRVVGVSEGTVTLLRVADTDGRRAHTGDLRTVECERLGAFEPAANPDENRSQSAALAGMIDGLSWQLRTFGQSLAARPLLTAVAVAVLGVGLVGDQFLSGPEWAFSAAVFAGSLGVAAIGSNLL
jgi:hypothetical protein